MLKKILLYGCSGNAFEALSIIRDNNINESKWKVVGLLDDNILKHGKKYYGVPVLGGKREIYSRPDCEILVVWGSPSSYLNKKKVIEELQIPKERFATIIHPSVVLGDCVSVGFNTLLMPGVVCTTSIQISDHVVILPNTVISHDSIIGSYSCIGSNVSISGTVNIQEQVYIGSGTRIINNIEIGKRSLIGLGSVVISSCDSDSVYVGNPARKISDIK